jgi:hypothetical protein
VCSVEGFFVEVKMKLNLEIDLPEDEVEKLQSLSKDYHRSVDWLTSYIVRAYLNGFFKK